MKDMINNEVDDLEEEEIPQEVLDYESAESLLESTEYIVRFERKVATLKDAAALYDALGDYEDAKEKKEYCLKKAKQEEQIGVEKSLQDAEKMLKEASGKFDYKKALAEFERIKEYRNVKSQVKQCKDALRKIDQIRCWRNRGILVCVVAALCILFTRTPLYPYAKGVVHQKMGQYQAAINCYVQSGGAINANSKMKKCYYILGEKYEKNQELDKALNCYYKSAGYTEKKSGKSGKKKLYFIESELLKKAKPGDKVSFSGRDWVVLEKNGEKYRLLGNARGHHVYGEKGKADWASSLLRKWSNDACYKHKFFKIERAQMTMVGNSNAAGQTDTADYVYALSKEEYENYKKIIPESKATWWLRDGNSSDKALCVQSDGTVTEEDITKKHAARAVINLDLEK